jgi:hypothetical protein
MLSTRPKPRPMQIALAKTVLIIDSYHLLLLMKMCSPSICKKYAVCRSSAMGCNPTLHLPGQLVLKLTAAS